MRKLMTYVSLQAFLFASLVQAGPLNGEQKEFFDRLGISQDMQVKDRVRVCAAALDRARTTKLSANLATGLGLIGTGLTVAQVLGNSKSSEVSRIKNAMEQLAKEKFEDLEKGSLTRGHFTREVEYFRDEYKLDVEKLNSVLADYAKRGDINYAAKRLQEIRAAADSKKRASLVLVPKDYLTVDKITAEQRELILASDVESKLSLEITQVLSGEVTGKKLEDLYEHAKGLANGTYYYKEGVRSGQFYGVDAYERDLSVVIGDGEVQAAKRAALYKKMGYSFAVLGAGVELYTAVQIYQDAAKAEAGPYSIDAAALGPVLGICGKAVSDDFNPSAMESISKVIKFAAVPLLFSSLEEAKDVDGKTTGGTNGKSIR